MNFMQTVKDALFNQGYPKVFGQESPNRQTSQEEYITRVYNAVFPIIEQLITTLNSTDKADPVELVFNDQQRKEAYLCTSILTSYFHLSVSNTQPNGQVGLSIKRSYHTCNLEIIPQITPAKEALKKEVPATPPMDLTKGPKAYPTLAILHALNADRFQSTDKMIVFPSEATYQVHSFAIFPFISYFENHPFDLPENSPLDEAALADLLNYIYTGYAPEFKDVDTTRTMLKSLGFLGAKTAQKEVRALFTHLLKQMDEHVTAENFVSLLKDCHQYGIDPLKTLCLSKLGLFMGDAEVARKTLKWAQKNQDGILLKAIASHVLYNDKLAQDLSLENLVKLAEIAIDQLDRESLAIALHALRAKVILQHEAFDWILPLARNLKEGALSNSELFEVCRYFARQFPEVLKPFISANALEHVRTLSFVQIKMLAAEAEALACKEVRMIAAKALAEKVTSATYQEVCQFCEHHSIEPALWKECQEIIANANKAALGALKKDATKEDAIAYIEAAEQVTSWDRVGTGLLHLVKKDWKNWDRFESFRDKTGNHARIKQAFELFDDADSGAED